MASIVCLLLAGSAFGALYSIEKTHEGSNFLHGFNVMNIPDPTLGRVNYVDAATAAAQNLTYGRGDTFILRAATDSVLDPAGPGRNSVRIESSATYGTSVIVFNLRHMPEGCGTWPAVWSFNDPWPSKGEIDILEGINDQKVNQATLHTTEGCTMDPRRPQKGTPLLNNCDVAATDNAGCSVSMTAKSFGPGFNANGGGWFAMERTPRAIRVWFWPRDSYSVPFDVKYGWSNIDTYFWGIPQAYFPSTSCNIAEKIGPHRVIINLTFCGVWAGIQGLFSAAGCPGTCDDYVNNNPEAFLNAYFDFAWLKIYT